MTSSNDKSKDGVKDNLEHETAGYTQLSPSGIFQCLIMESIVTPNIKFPPAESPIRMILS